jgi:hypothetical protein
MTDKATPTPSLRQRCDTALDCLPPSAYRASVAALFDDMLAEVERLAAQAASAPAVRMLTEDEAEKCYSLDEETFFDLDELIDMLDEEQAKPGFLVYEGESVRHAASHYARGAVADLFERMGEQAFDDAGEHIGDWPDHAVKGDNSAELEKLIYDWLDANVKVHFYTVKNVRQIALTADMLGDDDASRTIPPSGVIGDAA